MTSFWSHKWSPVVMTSTPAEKISSAILGVMPEPPAEFSPLAMTKSRACRSRSWGTSPLTARRPGCPTMSPMKRSFTRFTVMRIGHLNRRKRRGGCENPINRCQRQKNSRTVSIREHPLNAAINPCRRQAPDDFLSISNAHGANDLLHLQENPRVLRTCVAEMTFWQHDSTQDEREALWNGSKHLSI
jgi:hypothetical protein